MHGQEDTHEHIEVYARQLQMLTQQPRESNLSRLPYQLRSMISTMLFITVPAAGTPAPPNVRAAQSV
jgi:hypothetical protein